ncbi:MAG: MDR family MFS transporter [Solirubrobacteraceae bacterium]
MTDRGRLSPHVKAVAAVVVIGAIMSILDTTIVNVALESISQDLHAPLGTIQWIATGYLLALATVIPLTGWAAERFGPKRVWMTAVTGFVLTSALCAAAWSAESLIVFRVLQGLAGGMIMPIGMITLAQAAGPQHMGRVMSIVGVPMLLAPVLGPVLGGVLVEHLSWRWIFLVNLPIGIVGLALAARLLPSARAQGTAGPATLDVRGLLMLSPGVALFVFGLSEIASHGGATGVATFGPLVAGAALIAAFAVHAWRAPRPLVDVRLLRSRGFAAAAATVTLVGAALFGGMLLLPLYYQIDRGLSPLEAGLLIAPQGFGAAFAMHWSGRMTDRIGGGRVVVAGLIVLSLGTLPFVFVTGTTPYWLLAGALVIRGVGLGFTMMPAMASAYATLRHDQVPRATPMLNVLQRVGGSIGTAVLAVALQSQIRDAVAGAGVPRVPGAIEAVPPAARAQLADPVAAAFASTYWWAMGLVLLALIPATVLARAQRAAQAQAREAAAREAAAELDERRTEAQLAAVG